MTAIADALDRINRAVGAFALWLSLAMVLLQFAIVVMRYAFGFTSIFVNEAVLYLHASLFMLGAGYTMLVGGHVRVDIFHAKMTDAGKARVDLAGHVLLLFPALAMLLWWSWPMVSRSWAIWEGPISVGGIPASFLLKSLIPAYAGLLMVQGVSALLRDVLRARAVA
ncbi:MAG: TRAP transporter small permease subunit [Gemmobacter sp.]|uniref:TRAP transporter small permease subunit n=1 Tax=Gemmobacter sp. TaxID=1898957 RepID=UPI00391B453E